MTKIPSDDILEGVCKLRIRESEKLETVLELCNMEIHQKKAGPGCRRLKTMVKREVLIKICETIILKPEMEIMRQTPWSRIRGQNSVGQRTPGKCWQCSKGDNCSFRDDMKKRGKTTHPNPCPRSSTRQSVRNASRPEVLEA